MDDKQVTLTIWGGDVAKIEEFRKLISAKYNDGQEMSFEDAISELFNMALYNRQRLYSAMYLAAAQKENP